MAKIIRSSEQTAALKEIQTNLKNLKNINSFIDYINRENNGKNDILFSASAGSEKKLKAHFNLDKKTASELLIKQRKKLVKDIYNYSERFCILLEDCDKEILKSSEC